MKKILLFAGSLLFVQVLLSQGIVFSKDKTIREAVKKLGVGPKMVFVYLCSEGSKACEQMENGIFSRKEAGARFNTAFLNVKLAAASAEGATLVEKYGLKDGAGLFINYKSELVYKFSLPVSLEELLKNADRASVEGFSSQPIGLSMIQYPDKKTDRVFLKNYLSQLAKLQIPASAEYDQYLSLLSPEEMMADSTINLILLNRSPLEIHSAAFKLLWDKYSRLSSNLSFKRRLDGTIAASMRRGSQLVYLSGKKEELAFLLQLNRSSPDKYLSQESWEYEEEFYRSNLLYEDYLLIVVPKLEKLSKDLISRKWTGGDAAQNAAAGIINAVKFIAMNNTRADVLARMEVLAASAIELNPIDSPQRFLVWETHANVLYMQGKKAMAIERMRKALELIIVDDPRVNYKKQCGDELSKMEKGQKIW